MGLAHRRYARESATPRTRASSSPEASSSLLALIGLAAGAYTRRLRIGLVLGIVTCSILALGLDVTGAGYPYRLLFDYAPGWDGVRVPGRIFTLATLFYALLAGAGAQLLVRLAGAVGPAHALRALGPGSSALCC